MGSASGLDGQLDFYIRTAVVTHGSTMVAIAKESCLSDAAGAVATSDSGLTKSFEYKLFKGVNEDTTEQTIDVSVVICKAGESPKPVHQQTAHKMAKINFTITN